MRIVKTITLTLAMLWLSTLPVPTQASNFTDLKGNPNLRSASALVINAEGNVIYGKDIDTVRPIASITIASRCTLRLERSTKTSGFHLSMSPSATMAP